MRVTGLFKQSTIYLAGDLARRGVGFFLLPLYTNHLTPADYGVIEVIELFILVTGAAIGLGVLGDAVTRIYHEQPAKRDKCAVISTGALGAGALTFGMFCIVAVFARPLSAAAFRSDAYSGLVTAAFLGLFLGTLNDCALSYYRIQQRVVFFVACSLAQLVLTAGLNVYFIAFAGMGVWGFVLSKLICTGLGAAVLLTAVLHQTGVRFEREIAGRLARFAGPLIIASMSIFVLHFADRFFLARYSGLGAVGIYALAYKFGFLVTYLVGEPFGCAWNVRFYAHVGEPGWKEEFGRVLNYLTFFLVLAAVGLTVFAHEVITLVAAPAYRAAAALIPIIAFGYVFREVGDFFRGMLFINKRTFLFGRITFCCAMLNLLLNWLLISRHAAAGAAWATLLTWVAYMGGCWALARREHRIPYPVRSMARLVAVAVVACAPVLAIGDVSIWLRWAIGAGQVLLFVSLVWATGYFDRAEIASMFEWLRARRSRLRSLAAVE